MTDMPDFVRKAIAAQGKVDPDEILEKLDDEDEPDDVLLGVLEPQERIDLGLPIEPDEHA